MTGPELLNSIGARAYSSPLSAIRTSAKWPDLNSPLHLAILLIDFDTELCMNGILGFLENPTGAHLGKSIEAFAIIGAHETADALRTIQNAMERHRVTHSRLREPFRSSKEYEITSFAKMHPNLNDFAEEARTLARQLYIYSENAQKEAPFSLLEDYLAQREAEVLRQLKTFDPASSIA